jgi:RND family efflux transporter MFP subunit
MLGNIGRILGTFIVVGFAVYGAHWLWIYYRVDPWTRDGRVRADIVQVTPDVSGLVAEVSIRDNQVVHAGDTLFVIDRERFRLALQQADAVVENRRATWEQAVRDMDRYRKLDDVAVTKQQQEQTTAAAAEAEAAYKQAQADRDLARLNMDRSLVKASVDGIIANLDLRPGDYVTAGRPVFPLVDINSIHVQGYFEETKLPRISLGDKAKVQLMGERRILTGHVESIAPAIEDRERTPAPNLLANINPTFNWIRLAQRIPVRIALDEKPPGILLIMGRTANVEIIPSDH